MGVGVMVRLTGSECLRPQMELFMKENGRKTNNRVTAMKSGQTVLHIEGTTKMVRKMEMGFFHFLMEGVTQENFLKAKFMEEAPINGLMGESIMANGS